MVERLDDVVRRGAPSALGEDPLLVVEAEQVAREIAAMARTRGRRARQVFAASALALGLLGVGATAAVAGPGLAEWAGWVPDASAQRTFTINENATLGPCKVVARVVQEGGVPDKLAAERTEAARHFLASHDWDAAVASITAEDIAAELAAERERRAGPNLDGVEPPEVSTGLVASLLMGDRIREEFMHAGHLQPGVSLEMSGRCDGSTEGLKR